MDKGSFRDDMEGQDGISYFLFDSSQDVIFSNFTASIGRILFPRGVALDESQDRDVLMQIFAPLLASHKMLKSHLGVGYESLQSDTPGGLSLFLTEFLDFVLIVIGKNKTPSLRRAGCLAFEYLKKLCGPNPDILRTSPEYENLFRSVLLRADKLEGNIMRVFNAMVRLPSTSLYKEISKILESVLCPEFRSQKQSRHLICLLEGEQGVYPILESRGPSKLHPSDANFLITLAHDSRIPESSPERGQEIACFRVLLRTTISSLSPHTAYVARIGAPIRIVYATELSASELSLLALGLSTQIGLLSTTFKSSNEFLVTAGDAELLAISGKTILEKARPPKTKKTEFQQYVQEFANLSEYIKKGGGKSSNISRAISESMRNILKRWFTELCLETEDALRNQLSPEVSDIFSNLSRRLGDWTTTIESILKVGCLNLYTRIKETLTASEEVDIENLRAVSVLKSIKNLKFWTFINRSEHVLFTNLPLNRTVVNLEPLIYDAASSVLKRGNLTVSVKSGQDKIAYFLWFEDSRGNLLRVSKSKLRKYLIKRRKRKPRIQSLRLFTDPFYQEIMKCIFHEDVKERVQVFELLCVFQ